MSMDDFIKTLSTEQKEALLNALQKNDTPPEPESKVQNDFTVSSTRNSNNRRKEPVKARKNEWVDTGEFRDIETEYGERTPRNRKPSKKVDVECSVCGRSFKTDPKYVYGEYHRCNRCTGR
jgi:hypothetical protein